MQEEEEEDVVVEEYDVVVCPASVATLCVLGHPLRPPWRPYNYDDVKKLRMKQHAKRLEVDLPLSTNAKNYNTGGAEDYKQIEQVTLRSQQVEQPALTALGVLQDGKLLLAPVDMMLHMRPNLAHLNIARKGDGEGGGEDGEDDDEGGEGQMRAVEVQVQKRETERQQQARLNSYAYLAKKEDDEPWKEMKLHMDNTPVAEKVWDRLMTLPPDCPTLTHLSRASYLQAFAPSVFLADSQGSASGNQANGSTANGRTASAPAPTPSLASLSEACKTAFVTVVGGLFAKHSVCSLQNVRQWLLDPRHATGDAQKAAAAAAREAALFDDKSLHELMITHSGLQLACIRRMYVLKQTGRPETDSFRAVVVELLQDKEGFRRQEVTELASQRGVTVTDSLYTRVLKDICVNRSNTWSLKNGADI